MPRTASASLSAWIALFGIGLGWGSTLMFSKIIVSDNHHPIGITLTSTALGALLIGIAMVATGRRLPLRPKDLIFYAICGLLGTALPNSVGYLAYRELPVGVVAIVMAVVPITTMLGAVLMRIERAEPMRLLGLMLGVSSVLLLVIPETSLPSRDQVIWLILPIITSLSYTLENLYIAQAKRTDLDPMQILCGLFWAALAMLLPVTAASGTWMEIGTFDLAEWSLVAMTFAHLGAYGGFVWLIGRAGPVFAAQVAYVVTLTGVFLGIVVLGEAHSVWVWLSLVAMLVGLSLVQPRK